LYYLTPWVAAAAAAAAAPVYIASSLSWLSLSTLDTLDAGRRTAPRPPLPLPALSTMRGAA
jgi:CHASE2 domain-containing sensor protein